MFWVVDGPKWTSPGAPLNVAGSRRFASSMASPAAFEGPKSQYGWTLVAVKKWPSRSITWLGT